jgi:hypothetical protein
VINRGVAAERASARYAQSVQGFAKDVFRVVDIIVDRAMSFTGEV